MKQLLSSLLFLLAATSSAQYPGALDTTYRHWDAGYAKGDGTDDRVNTCAMRPDGRMLVGGQFSNINGGNQRMMGSLHIDGTLDASFLPTDLPSTWSPKIVYRMVVQPDGMVIVAGRFNRLVHRMQLSGEVDSTFITGAGFEGGSPAEAFALVRQPDGKILVGGRFTSYNGTPVVNLARLNANGTLDAGFSTASGINGDVLDLELQPDGKIIVVGRFTNCWGTCGHIVRLNANGTLDASFTASPGADADIEDVELRNDGTVLIAGEFYTADGASAPYLCRLTSTGAHDPTFTAAPGSVNASISRIHEQADERLLISVFNTAKRLLPDGDMDTTFHSPVLGYHTAYGRVIDALLQWPDGRIFITGNFTGVNGVSANHFALLHADGSIDATFNVSTGFNAQANCLSLLADGSVVVNGIFNGLDGVPVNGRPHTTAACTVLRLTPDGHLDSAGFTPYASATMRNTQAIQADGKILVGGFQLTRLNPDGSLDTGFPNGSLGGDLLQDIKVQPDGRILLSGNIAGFAGTSSPGLVRLNDDGTVDPTFNVGAGFANPPGVLGIDLQPDGRILATGWFTTYNGTTVNRICRLMPDGALDTSFHVGTGFSGTTSKVLVLPDGRILLAGYGTYNGYSSVGLVLLLPDGSVDSSFVNEAAQNVTNGWPILRYDPIGKILFGINTQTSGLRRLNLDGSIDPSFDTGSDALDQLTDLAVAADSSYLISGSFTSGIGWGRNRIARIQGGRTNMTTVQVKTYLGDAYTGGWSMTFLPYNLGILPLAEPYSALGYAHTGGGGGESIASLPTYPHYITDWVVVELRDAVNPSIVVATQSALLRRDGQVLSTDLLQNLVFNVPQGDYYVAVHHRNHLGVMTATSVPLDDMPMHVDFTLPSTLTYGTNAQEQVGSRMVLWTGDANGDGMVKYTGPGNDRDAVLVAIGGVNPLNIVSGYLIEDVNLDGVTKYTGPANDRDAILANLPGTLPTAVRLEQVP